MDWRWQHFFKSDVVMQQIFTIHLHFHRKGWLSQAVCSKFSRCLPEAAARPLSLSLRPARLAILTGRCQDEEVRKAIAVFQHGNTNTTPWEERNCLWNSSELNWIDIFDRYTWTIWQVSYIEDCDHETLSVRISMMGQIDGWRVPILGSHHLSSCKLIIFYFNWVNKIDSPELGFDLM